MNLGSRDQSFSEMIIFSNPKGGELGLVFPQAAAALATPLLRRLASA